MRLELRAIGAASVLGLLASIGTAQSEVVQMSHEFGAWTFTPLVHPAGRAPIGYLGELDTSVHSTSNICFILLEPTADALDWDLWAWEPGATLVDVAVYIDEMFGPDALKYRDTIDTTGASTPPLPLPMEAAVFAGDPFYTLFMNDTITNEVIDELEATGYPIIPELARMISSSTQSATVGGIVRPGTPSPIDPDCLAQLGPGVQVVHEFTMSHLANLMEVRHARLMGGDESPDPCDFFCSGCTPFTIVGPWTLTGSTFSPLGEWWCHYERTTTSGYHGWRRIGCFNCPSTTTSTSTASIQAPGNKLPCPASP